MSIDVMKQALKYTKPGAIVPVTPETVKILVDALRLAIKQAEKQEPVAWLYRDEWGTLKLSQVMPPPVGAFPVYTAAAKEMK